MTTSAPTARVAASEPVGYDGAADGVAVITLNRPDRRNAWTSDMEHAYLDCLEAATRDPAVRAIIVTGAGESFCPGLDPEALRASSQGARYDHDPRPRTFAMSVPKPVVAAINGNCAGIGLMQALCCDVRILDARARLSTAFSRRGLPAEDGAAWLLTRTVGYARALELLLSGRVFDAQEALALGLVHEVVEPGTALVRALDYARDLAANVSPHSMSMIKSQMLADSHATLAESLERARALVQVAKRHPDFREGVDSFVERRAPRFAPFSHPEA
jgi:enoyl-CoA hydratase/carnithine racemase